MDAPRLTAIVLAGGRASRVGGAVKPLFEVGGASLLAHAVQAAAEAGARPIVVAAPMLDDALDVVWAQEDPPFGGPVAGIVAAAPQVRPDAAWTLLLGADLPRARAAVARLLSALPLVGDDVDGVCLGDRSSRPQWLIAAYRTAPLRRAAAALPDSGRDASVRDLVADFAITVLAAPDAETADVDTWEDLSAARARPSSRPAPPVPEPVEGPSTQEVIPLSTLPPEALEDWSAALADRFGLDVSDIPIALVLDLARDVATGVARPAAPLSAFVAGLVAGRTGRDPQHVAAEISEVAARWSER